MAETKLNFFFMIVAATSVLLGHSFGQILSANESIRNSKTIVSPGEVFELGFFPQGSSSQYLGIWHAKIPDQTPVWVANRDKPLSGTTGALNLTSDGNLILSDDTGKAIWSTGTFNLTSPVLYFQDTGNLVLIDASSNITRWQSFDHPGDTFLLEMKLGVNFQTKSNRNLSSWKNDTDPSPGDYYYGVETRGVPQIFIWKGSKNIFRTGPWDGQQFSGSPEMTENGRFTFEFIWNTSEVYYSVKSLDKYTPSRAVMNDTGFFQRWVWSNDSNSWSHFWTVPADTCDNYGYCGANNICTQNYAAATCQCVQGFVAISQISSDGCKRRTALNCSLDKFLMLQNVKLPDTLNATANRDMNDLDQCKNLCLGNCSCTAYAINGENGCVTWFSDLSDLRALSPTGDVLYVRLASSEFGNEVKHSKKHILIVTIPVVMAFVLLVFLILVLCWRRRRTQGGYARSKRESSTEQYSDWSPIKAEHSHKSLDVESDLAPVPISLLRVLPSFDLATIRSATDDFSPDKKLGQGGFGIVYKGQLQNRQEIAVKKLSKRSFQRPDEFRNELLLIANLQHRNLVRLLGCCTEGDEQILILEFMQNGSLDSFIYDKTRRQLLNWRKRLDIIMGIARGLLYLHQDSNMKVVHRDLKPSNILLDKDLNPKISDFGISRIFEGDERHKYRTKKLAGTLGYMAPEYAKSGLFSLKSDVYSFGILVMEIVSGQRNTTFYNEDTDADLIGYAYTLWKEGKSLEILDSALDGSYSVTEVLRCVKVGLLCVQEKSEDRPTMGEVILMLSSEDPMLTVPKRPATIGSTSSTEHNTISVTIAGR